jgi:O-Antigen ligase
MAAAIPLVIAPGVLFFYDVTPKVVLLCCGTALTLPFVDPRRLLASAPGRWFCALLAAAWVSLLVSSVFSVRTDLSIFGTNWRRFGLITQSTLLLFVFVVAAGLSGGVERLRAYLRTSTVATVLIALYGILQYLGWDPWLDPKTYHVGTEPWTIVRPPGTLGYVTYLANYLIFGAFQGLALYRMERSVIWRCTGLAAVALASIGIVLSGTRAAWLALLVGGLVFVVLDARRPSPRTMWLLGGVAALAVLFYFSPAGLQLRSRMRWFREDAAGGARLYLWRDSLHLVARHWLVGSGPETFSVEFPLVQSPDLSRAFPEFYHESAHNIFLDAGTAQGLPGFLILLCAVALGFRSKRAAALQAGFAAILICHQFAVFTVPTALTFWITLAMLLTGEPAPSPATSHRRMLWLLPISLALIFVAFRMTIGDRHLAQMRNALDASRFDDANTECLAADRWGLHADIWYSRKLLSLGRTQQALTSGVSATVTADDPYNAWMNLALIYAKLDSANRTEYCIRKAIAADPNWYKPHLALAQLLLATGRQHDGQKELQTARNLNPSCCP